MMQNEKKDARKTNMAITFILVVAIECGLAGYLFWAQWDLFEALMADNPIFVFALFVCLMIPPMVAAKIAGDKAGRKVGDEAETMARNLRPS